MIIMIFLPQGFRRLAQNFVIYQELIKYFLCNLIKTDDVDNILYHYNLLHKFGDMSNLVGSYYPYICVLVQLMLEEEMKQNLHVY